MITIWRITSAIAAPLILPRNSVCNMARYPDDEGTDAIASAMSPASRGRSSSIRGGRSVIVCQLWIACIALVAASGGKSAVAAAPALLARQTF